MASIRALGVIFGALAIILLCSSQIIDAKNCPRGFQTCNEKQGLCKTNVNSDVLHCGKCNRECPSAPHSRRTCQKGYCRHICEDPFRDCDYSESNGCETNVEGNPNHCGKCGKKCPVPNANSIATCSNDGRCSFKCKPGSHLCHKACIDVIGNVNNCGICGVTCPVVANATSTCSGGQCSFTCIGKSADCDGISSNGCEVDTSTDVSHCGSCGVSCPNVVNATSTCSVGQCSFTCHGNSADCDGLASNGCEVDTSTDVSHCGSCGVSCPNVVNATSTCSGGQCSFTCHGNSADCDGLASNGCEVDTSTDVSHCGSCGVSCPNVVNATSTCSGGQCSFTCHGNSADCDGVASNGCEVDTSTDASHCGSCGVSCPSVANATSTCSGGQCSFTCHGNSADCDGDSSNGCEVDTSTDASHCGSCGVSCPNVANAASTCSNGQCGFTCNAGFGDCDGLASNGCEVDLSTSVANCNACGTLCQVTQNRHATPSCIVGQCGVICDPGFAHCDPHGSGCETDLSTVQNCGGCGVACPSAANSSPTCSDRQCHLQCDAGFADCDGDPRNGCEVDITTPSNCGRCGNACPAANAHAHATCTSGECGATCDNSFADCNGNPSDGCETNVSNDNSNCGGCGCSCGAVINAPGQPNIASTDCSGGFCNVHCNSDACTCNSHGCNCRNGLFRVNCPEVPSISGICAAPAGP